MPGSAAGHVSYVPPGLPASPLGLFAILANAHYAARTTQLTCYGTCGSDAAWENLCMETSRFDRLLRKAAQHTTRRETLGVLLGGALVAGNLAESEATKEAERRKKRHRRQGHQRTIPILKPIAMTVSNPGPNPVTVDYGGRYPLKCCWTAGSVTVPPGESRRVSTVKTSMYAWVAGNYWFEVTDSPFTTPPYATVAKNGQPPDGRNFCCQTFGTTVVHEMNVTGYHPIAIDDKTFYLIRLPTTNYIETQLVLPPNL